MVVINLFHFHIPLLMDHIGIFSIGLEFMSLLQASSSPPVLQSNTLDTNVADLPIPL